MDAERKQNFICQSRGFAYIDVPTIYESITDKIIQLIEENRTLPWSKPWHVSLAENATSGRRYRGINALILASSNYSDHRWLSFRQALELGGNVRRGERATQIVLWKFENESEQETERKRSVPLVRTFSVFNVQQCENLNLPPVEVTEISEEPLTAASQLLADYQDGPKVIFGGDRACYSPSADRIEMPTPSSFISGERYFSVLAHEAAHSSGAAHRLARKGIVEPIVFGSERYGEEELVAEISAAFLCAEYGIANTVEQSASYVDSWLGAVKRNRNLIFKAASQAQKATDLILGRTHKSTECLSQEPLTVEAFAFISELV